MRGDLEQNVVSENCHIYIHIYIKKISVYRLWGKHSA